MLPLHKRINYADEEHNLHLEFHEDNLKRHWDISSHHAPCEEDSDLVIGINNSIMMHLVFIGKHFSLKSLRPFCISESFIIMFYQKGN